MKCDCRKVEIGMLDIAGRKCRLVKFRRGMMSRESWIFVLTGRGAKQVQ